MKLAVHVLGRDVAVLEQASDFRSVLSYTPTRRRMISSRLTMPVRTESWAWDDQLPPVLQMNLPEGYLLQVLQEQFGPHIGASPIALLSVIGRNMVGRVQVAAPGATLDQPAQPIEVAALLKGDNSEEAFASGSPSCDQRRLGRGAQVPRRSPRDASRRWRRIARPACHAPAHHQGVEPQLPFVALNEHLCMQVAARVLPTARTDISDDGLALVVHRFDVDDQGQPHWGMEDFCALLGLRPAAKYDTTWERIAKAVRDHIPGERRLDSFRQLAKTLLLTYALRNADCHAKNLSLRYTRRADVHLAPAYDVLTTAAYAGFQHNPPGIEFMGKKTWTPGKNLQKFIAATFGVPAREQAAMVEAISDAVADVAATRTRIHGSATPASQTSASAC